jgi:hypothetical protein
MSRTVRIALRGLLVLAVLAALPAFLGGERQGGSPYLSALSGLAVPDVQAQVQCNDKGCVSGGHRHSNCGKLVGYYCYKYNGSSCSTGSCV